MLTGRQVVEARRLLRWSLARTANVAGIAVDRLLGAQGRSDEEIEEPIVEASLRRAFETAGVRFIVNEGGRSAELGIRKRLTSVDPPERN